MRRTRRLASCRRRRGSTRKASVRACEAPVRRTRADVEALRALRAAGPRARRVSLTRAGALPLAVSSCSRMTGRAWKTRKSSRLVSKRARRSRLTRAASSPVHLRLDASGLSLVGDGLSMRGDFAHLIPRIRPDRLGRELLVKAAKVKGLAGSRDFPPSPPLAVDATAGMGEDSCFWPLRVSRCSCSRETP